MYENVRTQLMARLAGSLDIDVIRYVLKTLDRIMIDYDVTKKETAIVVYDGALLETIKLYIMCREVEGMTEGAAKNIFYTLKKFAESMAKPVKEIKPNDVRAYLIMYQATYDINGASLDKIRQRISCFFEWCINEGIITANPMRNISPFKTAPSNRHALSEEQLEYCRMACKTDREKALLEVFYSTGARLSEIGRLTQGDINWLEGSIRVMGKGSSPYTVYLNAKAKVALRKYLESRKDNNPALFVTAKKPHNALTNRGIRCEIETIGKRAGLQETLCPHVLRHTMATTALRHGAPMEIVQKMLNHKSPTTTQIYAKLDGSRVSAEHQRTVV